MDNSFPSLDSLQEKIGYKFQNPALLEQACSHSSWVHENPQIEHSHNERLEFLGDSVLGLVIAQILFSKHEKVNEGTLSQMKSNLVQTKACARYVHSLEIADYLRLGKGEIHNRLNTSLLADFFEGLLASIYLDGGFQVAMEFVQKRLMDTILEILEEPSENYKALLQELTQKLYHIQPSYKLLQESGPDHAKIFEVAVFIEEKIKGTGEGPTKKQAEQNAARSAYEELKGKDHE